MIKLGFLRKIKLEKSTNVACLKKESKSKCPDNSEENIIFKIGFPTSKSNPSNTDVLLPIIPGVESNIKKPTVSEVNLQTVYISGSNLK